MTSTEPTVTSAICPAANPIAPAPMTAAPDQNSVRRPIPRSIRAAIAPATMAPAANAATCSPPTE